MQQEFSFPISPRPVRPSHPPLRRFMGVDNDIQRLDNTGFTCGHAFIVQLLLTFPLSSEYKIFFFFFFGYVMWLAGSQFPDQGMNPHPWQWEHRVLTTEPPENSLDRSFERDIERSTFFLSPHASMWFCSTLSKPPFPASSQQSNPFIFIYTEWPNTMNAISNSVWKFENSGYSKVCLFFLKVNYQERKSKSLVRMSIDSFLRSLC